MINVNKKLINIIIVFVGVFVIGCVSGLSSSSENNQESDDLLLQLNGYIIMDRPEDISAIELPSNEQIVVRERCKTDKSVHSLSGPDRRGRIAFIDSRLEPDIYSLKIIDMWTKKETEASHDRGLIGLI